MGTKKQVKKKGPRGKKARAKAKLERQWGETAIIDEDQQTHRVGKSRFLGKKLHEEKKKSLTSGRSKEDIGGPTKQEESIPENPHENDDNLNSDDSDFETDPMKKLLSLIQNSKGNSKKSIKSQRKGTNDSVVRHAMESGEDSDDSMRNSVDETDEDESSIDISVHKDDLSLDDTEQKDLDEDLLEGGINAETGVDWFRDRFSRMPLDESVIKTQSKSLTTVPVADNLDMLVTTYCGEKYLEGLLSGGKNTPRLWQEATRTAFIGTRKVLKHQWGRLYGDFSEQQAHVYPFLTRYTDMLVKIDSRKVNPLVVCCDTWPQVLTIILDHSTEKKWIKYIPCMPSIIY